MIDFRLYAKIVNLKSTHYKILLSRVHPSGMIEINEILKYQGHIYSGSPSLKHATLLLCFRAIKDRNLDKFINTQKWLNPNGVRVSVPKGTWPQAKKNSFFEFGKKGSTFAS